MPSKIELLDSDLLELPPSCLEFWPNNPSWFVIGTYELDKEEEEEDSWVDVGESSSEVVVNTDPFPHKEGIVSSAPLSLIDYSHSPHEFVEGSEISPNNEKDQSEPPSTLQKRNGSVMLYRLDGGSLTLCQSRPYSYGAIYDLHFCPTDPDYFAVSSSTGRISLFKITTNDDPSPNLEHVNTWKVFDDSVLITFFAWCPSKSKDGSLSLAVTASTGVVQILNITGAIYGKIHGSDLRLRREEPPIALHALKIPYSGEEPQYAYCCHWAFHPLSLSEKFHGIFSGGDDSKLRTCILGNPGNRENHFDWNLQTSFSGHDAAVISILPLPSGDYKWILLTGSYDNKVRIIAMEWSTGPVDTDELSQEKPISVMTDLDVEGGAYRLEFLHDYPKQPDPNQDLSFQILASCMEVGAKILQVQRKNNTWNIKIIASLNISIPKFPNPSEKSQLCYASAVQPATSKSGMVFNSSYFNKRRLSGTPRKVQLATTNGDAIFVSTCFNKRQLGVYKFVEGEGVDNGMDELVTGVKGL
ncbi:hypothetical protein SBOR_1766 [Sclerotinia borealis F-4128]|uniref:methylated diphthine methylhydrolase n=1 Tax=Sclerotinia borealis (strain F-4128) TaxID=1432307 RepID=W9CTT0_SCLBF|nr:hypothetical protein SBOR_1766 [Sclerotinia borealis F-4128]